MQKYLFVLLFGLSSLCTAGPAGEGQLAKYWGYFRFLSGTPVDDRLGEAYSPCPPLVGIELSRDASTSRFSLQARPFDADGKDRSFAGQGLQDPELPFAYFSWRFEGIGGPGHTFTSWAQGGDGFGAPRADWLARNVGVSIRSSLEKDGRVVQSVSMKPYTLAFLPSGKAARQHAVLEILEGAGPKRLVLQKFLDGKLRRSCLYEHEARRGHPIFEAR